jgi:hypothetical protein
MRNLIMMIFFILSLETLPAFSQLDPSSATLLKSTETETDGESLDESRYNVKSNQKSSVRLPEDTLSRDSGLSPKSVNLRPKAPNETASPPANQEQKQGQVLQSQTPLPPEKLGVETLNSNKGESLKTATENDSTQEKSSELGDHMRELILGGSQESIQEYKALLHPYDLRQNLVEIGASAGMFYQNSGSNYWYRRYYSFSPLITAETAFWLTPFLGFKGEFSTSLASEINGDPAGTRKIPADHQWWSGGIRFRKSFGLDRRSPHLLIGLDFNESRMTVPANDPDRIRVRTSGLAISAGLQRPSSQTHIWDFGVRLLPRADQQEGKTASAVRSGLKQQTYSVGFWIGSRLLLDRKNQYFWQISHCLDKSLYDGQANQVDPISGIQPSGVQVTLGTTLFRLGYTWGE